MTDMTEGARLIAEERARQIDEEGWTESHDQDHPMGALALAGACYALPHSIRERTLFGGPSLASILWPWEDQWWKPAQNASADARIRELTKAGALIAAEIDYIIRFRDDL